MNKKGNALLALAFALTACNTVQYNQDNTRLSNEKYNQLFEIIKKQKEREPFKQTTENNLENITEEDKKVEQSEPQQSNVSEQTPQIIYSDSIYDFLRLNYGQNTVDSLSLSNKYEEIMTNLASIPKFQEVIPALMQGLNLQIDRSYRGKARDEIPSFDAELALLSLIPSIQNNTGLANLVNSLNSQGVSLDVAPSKESSQPDYILPNIFLRVKDWLKSNGEKQIIEFSAQDFLEEIISRYDLRDFIEHPDKLDAELNKWLSRNKHSIQSSGGFFQDGYEDWQNYKNLDLVQKLQLYNMMFNLNWGSLKEEITELRELDLMLDYTEVGGEIKVLEDGMHFIQVENISQKFYPEESAPLMRIAGLTQDLDELQRVQIYGRKEWLNEEQASKLSEEQKRMILEKYAEGRNARLNIHYASEYLRGIGNFHFHSEIMHSSQVAGPSGWLTEQPFDLQGGLKIDGDLACAAQNLDYRGKYFMNVLITSIDKDTFDVNLYYACGANGKAVNVSVGEYKTIKVKEEK